MNPSPSNSNGMSIGPYLGYARNFLGSGYNCPALKLFGYRTERALNRQILKAYTEKKDRESVAKRSQ